MSISKPDLSWGSYNPKEGSFVCMWCIILFLAFTSYLCWGNAVSQIVPLQCHSHTLYGLSVCDIGLLLCQSFLDHQSVKSHLSRSTHMLTHTHTNVLSQSYAIHSSKMILSKFILTTNFVFAIHHTHVLHLSLVKVYISLYITLNHQKKEI